MVEAASIGTLQFWAVIGAFLGMMFGYMVRPMVEHFMAPLYTVFMGFGPDHYYTKTKVSNQKLKRNEWQDGKGAGPIVKITPATSFVDKKNGGRIVAYNTLSGTGLEPKSRLASLFDNLDAAIDHSSRNIERVHKSHGEIPWALLILGGILGVVLLVAILAGVIGWVYTSRA